MSRRLRNAVHLLHPVTHEPVILQPGDKPEAEVAELITHPDAWEPEAPMLDDPGLVGEASEAPTLDDPPFLQEQVTTGEPVSEPEPEPEPEPERAAPGRRRKAADAGT
ncbi:hypothetical protein [Streptomyces sp. NPDC001815]|uniref:hypothetical protein n=1 Tax=Streptomyces sp. NPDC001815 TaxID=3154526 RepID=UPI003321136C